MPDFIIRHPSEADRVMLRYFSARVLPDLPEDFLNQRWWWLQAPARTLVAEHVQTGHIAGICGAREIRTWIQGEATPSIAISDWFVSPDYFGRGLGKRLLVQQMQDETMVISLGITEVAAENFIRTGWEAPNRVPLYLALFPGFMARLRGWRNSPYDLRVHEMKHGDPINDREIDTLWETCDKSLPMMVRDSQELRRHLSLMPGYSYTLVMCHENQRPVGYMLSRLMPPGAIRQLGQRRVAAIVDFLVDSEAPRAFDRMLVASFRHLAAQGAGAAIIMATAPGLEAKLPGYGFISAKTPLVGRLLKKLATTFMYRTSELPNPGADWYLTLADCDQDFSRGSETAG